MRYHVFSNSPDSPTGYGVQMGVFLPRWTTQYPGRSFTMTAFYGHQGAPLVTDNLFIYPGSKHPYALDRIHFDYRHSQADILITLIDAWIFNSIAQDMVRMRWAAYAPVDHDPIPQPVVAALRLAWQPIAYSKFGLAQMERVGLKPLYAPHAFDPAQYNLGMTKQAARRELGISDSVFVAAIVAANKGDNPPRKAWEQQIRAFAQFREKRPDAILYLHTDMEGISGVNIEQVLEINGVPRGVVARADQGMFGAGLFTHQYMRAVYSASDVLLNATMGEGFGVPIMEAQACGCPVIVGNYTSMPELVKGGWTVEARDKWLTPQGSYQFIPNVDDIAEKLELAYQDRNNEDLRQQAAKGMLDEYAVDHVNTTYWEPIFDNMEKRLASERGSKSTLPLSVNGNIPQKSITIITPWLNHPELIADYEQAVERADQVIIIDNGSTPENAVQLHAMIERLHGVYIRNGSNKGYSGANNQGLAQAWGDIVIFMNNDVRATDPLWLDLVKRDVSDKALVGVAKMFREIAGLGVPYLEGFCIAGTREGWQAIGGWDDVSYPGAYWEDNEVCLRALVHGYDLQVGKWGILHLNGGNTTTRELPDGHSYADVNKATFEQHVRERLLKVNGRYAPELVAAI